MERHGRCIWQLEPVLNVHLQDLMLVRWLAAIRFQNYIHRRQSLAIGISHPGAKLQHERRARRAQRVSWSTQSVGRWMRGTHHRVQHSGRTNLALKSGAVDCRLEVGGSERVEHLDDLIATKVGGITHRWSPIAVANAGVLVQEVGVLYN